MRLVFKFGKLCLGLLLSFTVSGIAVWMVTGSTTPDSGFILRSVVYLLIGVGIFGLAAFFSTFVRGVYQFGRNLRPYTLVSGNIALRQGLQTAVLGLILLFLQTKSLLTWWLVLELVGFILALEWFWVKWSGKDM